MAEEIPLNPGQLTDSTSTHPYFTDYVRDLLLQDFSSDIIQQGGLKVYTTLEPDKQQVAEEAAADTVSSINDPDVCGVLVSIDNSNGHIVAMVGGQNYGYDEEAGQSVINMAVEPRQAGSSFKTFTLIAAMREGMSPTVMLDCRSPMQITSEWAPHNFNNNQYGIITLARATELSSNTAYAQVVMAVGVDKLQETAALMGIDTPINPYPASSLGSTEVTPLEMCEAYSTLASGGVHRNAVAITRIEDRNGNVVYEHEDDAEQVLDSAIAADAIEVLEGVFNAGYTTSYVNAYFNANQPVAGKTGTADEAGDLWFCGFTPQYTTVTWVGRYSGNSAVYVWGSYASTANTAQPIWTAYMNTILEGVERGSWPSTRTTAPGPSWAPPPR